MQGWGWTVLEYNYQRRPICHHIIPSIHFHLRSTESSLALLSYSTSLLLFFLLSPSASRSFHALLGQAANHTPFFPLRSPSSLVVLAVFLRDPTYLARTDWRLPEKIETSTNLRVQSKRQRFYFSQKLVCRSVGHSRKQGLRQVTLAIVNDTFPTPYLPPPPILPRVRINKAPPFLDNHVDESISTQIPTLTALKFFSFLRNSSKPSFEPHAHVHSLFVPCESGARLTAAAHLLCAGQRKCASAPLPPTSFSVALVALLLFRRRRYMQSTSLSKQTSVTQLQHITLYPTRALCCRA